MVTAVFGYKMKHIPCPYCEHPHLDKDWFSVHPHRRHLCAGCGRHFRDTEAAIGNPIGRISNALRGIARKPKQAKKPLRIRQSDYAGGIQIWGSNPALLWTGDEHEQEGIHVHAFRQEGDKLILAEDETFSALTIDGVSLDPLMVRTLMAQSALPHLADRVEAIRCPRCGTSKFDAGEHAFTPTAAHHCSGCKKGFPSRGRLRKTIGNPLVEILSHLATYAPRPPQKHAMGLLPETL
jgi:transposase-like protein